MKPKVLIWVNTKWSLGRVHYSLMKYMSKWYDFDIIDWKLDYKVCFDPKYDIILSTTCMTWVLGDLFKKISHKVISVSHCSHFNVPRFTERIEKYDDTVYCGISKECIESYKNVYNVDAHLTPTGIDLELFYPTRHIKKIRKIGFIGNPNICDEWCKVKRPEMFLEIAKKANVEPIFIHGKDLNLNNHLYDDIDMLLYCSTLEGAGQGLLEAGACNIPVISTKVGYAQYFKNIKTFETADEAVEIINHFNENPSELIDYTANLGNEIRSEWNWEILVDKYWKPVFEKVSKYKFVEIGTSDFDYNQGDEKGLYIEPIEEYYDRLVINSKSKKVKCAITHNKTAEHCDVYYIPSDIIEKNNLPNWLRGCNSINKPHYQHQFYNHEIKDKVELVNIVELFEEYKLFGLDYVKIDTEGHDCVIMTGIYEYFKDKDVKLYPKEITFETNILSDCEEISLVMKKFETLGYQSQGRNGDNTTLLLTSPHHLVGN